MDQERGADCATNPASLFQNETRADGATLSGGHERKDSRSGPIAQALRLYDGRVIQLPAIMGVLNVTPDSFSDGGLYLDPERAVAHAFEMAAAGASIIDIGGESSRPMGARGVTEEVELARLMPVLKRLSGNLSVPLSIDTRKPEVARAALDMGAAIINDISALSSPTMTTLAAERRCVVVLMHMRGGLEDHIQFASYENAVDEVLTFLAERALVAERAGIERSQIIVDPGLGFAKTAQHNLAILANLNRFCGLGYPLLVGASRKNFIRNIAGDRDDEILLGTNAVNAVAVAAGASIVRVHDPASAAVTVRTAAAIAAARHI